MNSIPAPLRFGAILAASFLMTCLCFLIMYTLVSTDLAPPEQPSFSLSLPVTEAHPEDRPPEPKRARPERVMPADVPPQPEGKPLRTAEPVTIRAQLPTYGSVADLIGTEDLELRLTPPMQDVVPLYVVQPVYPFKAVMNEIEGFVVVSFTVRENGSVVNPIVVASEPGEIFDQAAIAAASRFRFQPRRVGVDHVAVSDLSLRFVFELNGAAATISRLE